VKELFPFIGYESGELLVEEVPVKRLVQELGTPLYVYSRKALEFWFREFDDAFSDVEHLTCFAVKANSNVNILKLLKDLGAGADTVSMGEIFRALTAGIPPEKIVFAGVGKRKEEVEYALERGILMFNVESEGELELIESVASRLGVEAPVAVRVNPDVDPKTHPYISTGLKAAKFGVTLEEAERLYLFAKESKYLRPVGVHFHIGSQITDVSAFGEAAGKVSELVKVLRDRGVELEFFDAGGGLGINYHPEEEVVPAERLARELIPIVKELGLKLILEPGRRVTGNAGLLLTEVLYVKERGDKTFYVVDAGMNDIARPALYGAYHHVVPVVGREGKKRRVDVVGPICETGDIIARDRELPEVKPGDYLAVLSAGAYGFSMSSNYNSRPRPAEVLVDGASYRVIRQRESLADLISREF